MFKDQLHSSEPIWVPGKVVCIREYQLHNN